MRRARADRAALRAAARTSTARCSDIAGVCNEAGNVFGLMPHPEHAVDALTGGSADGLKIFESMRLAVDGARGVTAAAATAPTLQDALALGLTARRVRADRARSWRRRRTRSSWRCSRCCGASTAPTSTPRSCCARCRPRAAHVVMGPGENAGAVDVGDGLACAFKVESHNHPSAVEPFQGAATGVGGILRDIFAIGARPIAVLDSLRFGEPTASRRRARATCSTAPSPGIGHYGNSIGVPTIGGEVYFEGPYEQNCLVNAMALGLAEQARLVRSAAAGRGQRAACCSAPRPGATGSAAPRCWPRPSWAATRASGDADKRPTVQVGDPFEEKKLLECSLELLERGPARRAAGPRRGRPDLVGRGDGLQGRGRHRHRRRARAAARGRHGAVRDHGLRVPGADAVRRRARASVDEVLALCEKWEVDGAAIGTVTDSGRVRVLRDGELVGDMPVRALVDDCPLYDLDPQQARRRRSTRRRRAALAADADAARDAARAAGSPEHRLAPAAVRAVRRDRAVAHGAPPRAGRRRRARAAPTAARWPVEHRRQRPPRRRRPYTRHGRGGARVRGQPRLRRAPSRWARPTTSTSATPRSRTSPGS